ncbi:MAG: hypothetical protein H0T62_13080 [Parachlamydiaceae bacterium]|nr:hypothetical protein [Parachlamydiaceae bacterium]
MTTKKSLLLLTDFYYQAKGREYFREDLEMSCFLRKYFNVFISHIEDAGQLVDQVDIVLIRNTGPQIYHPRQLMALQKRKDLVIFNDLAGKGDIKGKQHLFELYRLGFPVIPAYSSKEELHSIPPVERYLLKPLDGADSCGVKILSKQELQKVDCQNVLIQPVVDFLHEVSFYFIGEQFYYALYAPNPSKRWVLESYVPTEDDLKFALKFIDWNSCKWGIQRVDACRLQDGSLLLMELEDYNPFLSLDLLSKDVKEQFLEGLCLSLTELLEARTE